MRWIIAIMMVLSLAGAASASERGTRVDAIVSQIETQGYRVEKMNRTWLGRVRIRSVGPRGERETVVNPYTGEILRDLLTTRPSVAASQPGSNPQVGGDDDGSDDNGDDDGGDDDGGDDDGGDDDGGDDGGGDEGDDGGGDEGDDGGGDDGGGDDGGGDDGDGGDGEGDD